MGHPSVIIAAPSSGSGKTTVTLGLIRAFCDRGVNISSAKIGPDYIDPRFHEMAGNRRCINLDSWSMRERLFEKLVLECEPRSDLFIIEGVMGLFDGAAERGAFGNGSTASVAKKLQAPVILVVDAKSQAQSVAALVKGFRDHDPGLHLAGIILNRVGSDRHAQLIKEALDKENIFIFGFIPQCKKLELASRYLGLVQAHELKDIDKHIDGIAKIIDDHIDLNAIRKVADSHTVTRQALSSGIKPLGQHISIANDAAFSFIYPHIIESWRESGVKITFFSPLKDETPDPNSDAVYLPGGYPELYAEQLAHNINFFNSLRIAAGQNKFIFGECGGYMVLGDYLIDQSGTQHEMAGLLPLTTSFENKKLSLGYRTATTVGKTPFGPVGTRFRCHEFHYASIITNKGENLFDAEDAAHTKLGSIGSKNKSVLGSFMHLIDYA